LIGVDQKWPSILQNGAFDPKRTFAASNGNELDAGFYPYPSVSEPLRYRLQSLGPDMQRRHFVKLLGGAAAVWPGAVWAQQSTKLPTIGFLGAASQSNWTEWTKAFVNRLHELGWIEGRTVMIEYRWADGSRERFAEIAAEFVRLKVNVIVTAASAAVVAKQVTSTIPIVLGVATDPVGDGLVTSLARPGGNITGLSLQQIEVAGKRLELLREVFPGLRNLGIMFDASYPANLLEVGEAEAMARKLGISTTRLAVRRAEDIAPAFDSLKSDGYALYICTDAITVTNRQRIYTLALSALIPVIAGTSEDLATGGLISYGPNFADLFGRAADYVDKILRGAKPGDLPVQQPTKFYLVVNLKAAKMLGLSVPLHLQQLADEVIE
jgi:ABC-type uncharacterized transport system substrate-binding protein